MSLRLTSVARRCRALALALAAAAICGCAEAPENRPEFETPSAPPKRIVSLAPNVTEILFALGVGGRVVGVTTQDNYPPEAASKEKIGDASSNIEKVLSLKPDLVIGHAFLNSRALDALQTLSVPVLGVEAKDLASVGESVRKVAARCGVQDRGDEIAAEMDGFFGKIRNGYGNVKGRPAVLFAAQANPLWAAGSRTFVDEMIRLAGGENAGRDAGEEFAVLSEEVAVSRDPEFILVTDEPALRHFKTSKAWAGVRAVKNSRVILVNPDLYLRPGPRLVEGQKELCRLLHPEVEVPG